VAWTYGGFQYRNIFDSFPSTETDLQRCKRDWYDLDNPEEAKIARAGFADLQTDKIIRPFFVVQGAMSRE